jgi:FkbM family methyltransferase
MKHIVLPNQLEICTLSDDEALILYHEIFTTQAYLKHGILVAPGDCVFDVGANIGLFSVYLACAFPGLDLYAFEPMPDVFSVLQCNAAKYFAGAKLFQLALSDHGGTAQFEFDRFASFAATMNTQSVDGSVRKNAPLQEWVRATIEDLQRIGKVPQKSAQSLQSGLSNPLVRPVLVALWLLLVGLSTLRKRVFLKRVICPLNTLSAVIAEDNISAIHLLKVDVEGSELDVLHGIAPQDWPRIKQLVVEVHDVGNRINTMRGLLESQGYRVVLDQEDWALHKLLGIFTLYAIRNEPL